MGDPPKIGQRSVPYTEAGLLAPDPYLQLIESFYLPALRQVQSIACAFPDGMRQSHPAVSVLIDDMRVQSEKALEYLMRARGLLYRIEMGARNARVPLSYLGATARTLRDNCVSVVVNGRNGEINERTFIDLSSTVDRVAMIAKQMSELPRPTFLQGLAAQAQNLSYRIYQTGVLAVRTGGNQIGMLRETVTAIRGTPLERGPVILGIAAAALVAGAAILIYEEMNESTDAKKTGTSKIDKPPSK